MEEGALIFVCVEALCVCSLWFCRKEKRTRKRGCVV